MGDTLFDCTVWYQVASVIGDVALFSECVEYNHGVCVEAARLRECLDHCLVVAWFAGESAEAVVLQRGIRHLHDGFVGCVESIFVAYSFDLGVLDIAPCSTEQALYGGRVWFDFFEA